jgi:hypothetical protein
MTAPGPPPDIAAIQQRLEVIFPEGVSDRNYVVRSMAARTVYVMLYIGAVEGSNVWLAPKHVYRMTAEQAGRMSEFERSSYREDAIRPGFSPDGQRWYADNTREPIRDETLRDGLVAKGAVVVNGGIPTTSSKGRYALNREFAQLFRAGSADFPALADKWRKNYLSAGALAKVRILRGAHGDAGVTVRFPGGESRVMEAGPSSEIAKAVIENFSKRFLKEPAILWVSQSGNKVVLKDEQLMGDLNMPINQSQLLPDLVMADLGRDPILLIFVEVVATDGPVTEARKAQFLELTDSAGYERSQVVFLTAFRKRNAAPLKRRLDGLAVDSAVWCMAEPDLLIWLGEKRSNPFPISG